MSFALLVDMGKKLWRICIAILSGTRCRYFGHVPPTLHDYIPLDEELIPPPAVDLGELWNYNDQ